MDKNLNRIIEVHWSKPGESRPKTNRCDGSKFMLLEELFRDDSSPRTFVPKKFLQAVCLGYYGWQHVDLHTCKMKIPEGATETEKKTFGDCLNRVVWFRFVSDEESFVNGNRKLTDQQSAGLKRVLLEQHGFEYCGRRVSTNTSCKDACGFAARNFAREVWGHSNGAVITFLSSDTVEFFGGAALFIKIAGTTIRDPRIRHLLPHCGETVFSPALHDESDGLVARFTSTKELKNLWSFIQDPNLIARWDEGLNGLKRLSLPTYGEQCDAENPETFQVRLERDLQKLADNSALLRRICC